MLQGHESRLCCVFWQNNKPGLRHSFLHKYQLCSLGHQGRGRFLKAPPDILAERFPDSACQRILVLLPSRLHSYTCSSLMSRASYPASCPCPRPDTTTRFCDPEILTTRRRVASPVKSIENGVGGSWAVSPAPQSVSSRTTPSHDTRIPLNDELPDRPTSMRRSHRKRETSDLFLDHSNALHR